MRMKDLSLHLWHSPYYLSQRYLPSSKSSPKNAFNKDSTGRLSPALQPDHAPFNTTSRPATRALPPATSQRPAPAPSLTTLIQSDSVDDLLALSQEVFARPKSPKATTSVKSKLTPRSETKNRDRSSRSCPAPKWASRRKYQWARSYEKNTADWL